MKELETERRTIKALQAEKREHESVCSVAEELAQQYRKVRDAALARLAAMEGP